jgi:branched-chain amino acid transport system permease protein
MFQVLLTGLATGAIYGLIAMAYAVVFYVTRVINFATGQLFMACIMITMAVSNAGFSIWWAILAGFATSSIGGVVVYFIAVRPVLRFDRFSFAWLVSTLGVGIILESLAALKWGTSSLPFPNMLNGRDVSIFNAKLTWQQIITIAVGIAVVGLFELLRTKTLFGKMGMAISSDPDIASSMGANVTRYTIFAFALGGLLAGIAGVLVGPFSFASPYLGESFGISGFVALMIGGIERPAASMGGGLILGVLTVLANTYINSQASDWFPFIVVVVVLIISPNGVFMAGSSVKSMMRWATRARTKVAP